MKGKRDEKFDAYRCQFDADAPANAAYFTKQSEEGDARQDLHSDPFELARSNEAAWLRVNAIRRIDDQDQLETIALTEGEGNVRAAAIRRLQNQKILERLARTDPFPVARLAAVEGLESKKALTIVVRDEASEVVRTAAKERVGALGNVAPMARVESAEPTPSRVRSYRLTGLRVLSASGIVLLLVVGAVTLAYRTSAPLLAASCAWSVRVGTNPDYPLSLECRFENRGKEPAEETVLELPFLCSRASLDGSEASRYFGEKVFREDARPPAPFTIGVIGAGRSRSAAFVPLTKGLRVPSVDWCDPSAYLLRDGKRQGAVEITICMP